MKFNLAYLGPEALFHLRRDFLLATKYGLEDLGHDVLMSGRQLDTSRFNLVVGAYFLPSAEIAQLARSGVKFAHVNTEIVADGTLNFNPEKVDFHGAYLPSLKAGAFVWDVVLDNLEQYPRYGVRAHFLRWGWHPKLEDIERNREKTLDYYLFGMMSARRIAVLQSLERAGFRGMADGTCPYFVRNDRIARAKVNLNVIQDDKYTHVNSFRICYLANNGAAILSEAEKDPAGYLEVAEVIHGKDEIPAAMKSLIAGDRWRRVGEAGYEKFRQTPMKACMEKLVDESFGPEGAQAVAAGGA